MNEFDTYKSHLEKYPNIAQIKEKVRKIITQKGLSSVMNDTKWLELQKAIEDLPFPPPFILRCVTDDSSCPPMEFDKIPSYHGDWSSYYYEGLPPFFNIEWMEVYPKCRKYRGKLIADEILDETEAFVAVLKNLAIPYTEEGGVFTIYGYK